MLISVVEIARRYRLHPQTVLHVGAHQAEELDAYRAAGWGDSLTLWVEADPILAEALRSRVETEGGCHVVVEMLAWDSTGTELQFFRASNSQSSSALAFEEHSSMYPDISVAEILSMRAQRLDDALRHIELPLDFVNLDVQGAELRALQGLGQRLDDVKAIYSEVNRRELYAEVPMVEDMDLWLGQRGFVRVLTRWNPQGWGDALWIKEAQLDSVPPRPLHDAASQGLERLRYSGKWVRWRLAQLRNRIRS